MGNLSWGMSKRDSNHLTRVFVQDILYGKERVLLLVSLTPLCCLTVSLKQLCYNFSYDFPIKDVLFVSYSCHRKVIGNAMGKLV